MSTPRSLWTDILISPLLMPVLPGITWGEHVYVCVRTMMGVEKLSIGVCGLCHLECETNTIGKPYQ